MGADGYDLMGERLKCRYADKYQATREPKCGCVTCWVKWLNARIDRLENKDRRLGPSSKSPYDAGDADRIERALGKRSG